MNVPALLETFKGVEVTGDISDINQAKIQEGIKQAAVLNNRCCTSHIVNACQIIHHTLSM